MGVFKVAVCFHSLLGSFPRAPHNLKALGSRGDVKGVRETKREEAERCWHSKRIEVSIYIA